MQDNAFYTKHHAVIRNPTNGFMFWSQLINKILVKIQRYAHTNKELAKKKQKEKPVPSF